MSDTENTHQHASPAVQASETPKATPDKIPAPTIDELYSDPEVCRRVGDLISAVTRRPPLAKY
jgi:hypothetical protein